MNKNFFTLNLMYFIFINFSRSYFSPQQIFFYSYPYNNYYLTSTMKFPIVLLTLLSLLAISNAHQVFNYHDFLKVFDLKFQTKFPYDAFAKVFFGSSISNKHENTQIRVFNYDDFTQIFFASKPENDQFNYQDFIRTFLKNKSQISQNNQSQSNQDQKKTFDYNAFKKALEIECKENCSELDYKKFAQSLKLFIKNNKSLELDTQKFAQVFGLKWATASQKKINYPHFCKTFSIINRKAFDYGNFIETFSIKRRNILDYKDFCKTFSIVIRRNFDYKKFAQIFLVNEEDLKNGGAIRIIDIGNLRSMNN